MESRAAAGLKDATCCNTQLKKFVELAEKQQTQTALEMVLVQALEASGLYVFAELLALDSVKALEKAEDASGKQYWKLLNLFAYGTMQDYQAESSNLPVLSSTMMKKLQLLTLMTLASHVKYLPYEKLRQELCIENNRKLEDLLIQAMYEGIIQGRLDQLNSRLEVDWSEGRDVKYTDMHQIISTLENWCAGCESQLSEMSAQVNLSEKFVTDERTRKLHLTLNIEQMIHTLNSNPSSSSTTTATAGGVGANISSSSFVNLAASNESLPPMSVDQAGSSSSSQMTYGQQQLHPPSGVIPPASSSSSITLAPNFDVKSKKQKKTLPTSKLWSKN